ncbi:hypothetical protein TNCV_50111 [Trichonephila clavipes]|nr:hypothetical protein TNCV_50111 [Trichonephila clavipes]
MIRLKYKFAIWVRNNPKRALATMKNYSPIYNSRDTSRMSKLRKGCVQDLTWPYNQSTNILGTKAALIGKYNIRHHHLPISSIVASLKSQMSVIRTNGMDAKERRARSFSSNNRFESVRCYSFCFR